MSNIQRLLKDRGNDKINYKQIIEKYPWVIEPKQNCIISPDSDGLLCGLLMSHYLGWRIKGFYDGKVLVVENTVNPKNCVFLDMEIFRPNIRSIGQHMVMYDKKDLPPNWKNFHRCISSNNLRNYDFKNDFKFKYPFGTVHMLLSILGQGRNISITKNAVAPLLYTDGAFKNQFNYPENCLSWLDFLEADNAKNPLQKIFLDKNYSTYELMNELKYLFAEINIIGGEKRGGDKIKISDLKGNVANIDPLTHLLKPVTITQAVNFLKMLADKTGWDFTPSHWSWGPYQVTQFKKGSIKPGKNNYNSLIAKNPVSLAIISRNSIEYTLDNNMIF